MTASLAAATSDRGHVLAIAAHGDATFASRFARFARVEFVRGALGMRRLSTLARDFLLLRAVHRCESAVAPRTRRRSVPRRWHCPDERCHWSRRVVRHGRQVRPACFDRLPVCSASYSSSRFGLTPMVDVQARMCVRSDAMGLPWHSPTDCTARECANGRPRVDVTHPRRALQKRVHVRAIFTRMSLSIRLLGTSASRPTVERNVSSLAIHREGETLMFDCGEGTQRQMMRYGVSFALEDIFFTHMHADHLLGVIGLMRTMALQGRTERLRLWGPTRRRRAFSNAPRASGSSARPFRSRSWSSTPANDSSAPATRSSPFPSSTAARRRSATRSSRKNGRADSIPDLARELGIPEGPMWGQIHRGQAVTLPDGRVIEPRVLVGDKRPGRTVVITGDTRPCAATIDAARDADLLIHEATFGDEEAERAVETGHSTAREAALVARESGVRQIAAHAFLGALLARRGRPGARSEAGLRSTRSLEKMAWKSTSLFGTHRRPSNEPPSRRQPFDASAGNNGSGRDTFIDRRYKTARSSLVNPSRTLVLDKSRRDAARFGAVADEPIVSVESRAHAAGMTKDHHRVARAGQIDVDDPVDAVGSAPVSFLRHDRCRRLGLRSNRPAPATTAAGRRSRRRLRARTGRRARRAASRAARGGHSSRSGKSTRPRRRSLS